MLDATGKIRFTIKTEIDGTISQILDNFYSDKNSFSDVTSSYWKTNDNNILEIKNNIVELKNAGSFGDFTSNSKKKILIHLTESILTSYLLRKNKVDKELIRVSRLICARQEKLLMFDSAKQLIILNNLIKNHQLENYNSFCVIGDGYGFLTSMLRELFPTKKIINVNLGRQLLYDYILFKKACPMAKSTWYDGNENQDISSSDSIFIPAEKYDLLKSLEIEFFFNIASMQEMNLNIIKNYIEYMRNNKAVFYCCNRDSKTLPDGTVINFDEYGWGEGKIIFDRIPEWYQSYPSPRPPLWRPFDGKMRERLFKF